MTIENMIAMSAVCSVLTAIQARRKGYHWLLGLPVGMALGVVGIVVMYFVRDRRIS